MRLNHHRRGSGEPLLLIHGLGSRWQAWAPVLDRLQAQRDVIAVDLPGFGDSSPLPSGLRPTVPALADAVERFLDGLELSQVHVGGNSLGGWLALELSRRGRARSVLALSPAGFWTTRESAYASALLRATALGSRALNPVGRLAYGSAATRTVLFSAYYGRPWRLDGATVAADTRNLTHSVGFDATRRELFSDRFSGGDELLGEIVIGWGTRDRLLLPRQAARAQRAIPAARLVMLRGCGHIPMSDDPQRVSELLLGRA